MATLVKIKYKNQKDHLPSVMKAVLAYCLQPEKTRLDEDAWTVNGQNCTPEIAYRQFMANKAAWKKTEGLCFRHYVQSFHPDEEITPELANEIGMEFAACAWEGYAVVVATHVDRDHIHNHFIIDTMNVENGRKLHEDRGNIERLRELNDEICSAHGLSVLSKYKNGETKSIGSREYRSGSRGESWKFRLRRAIKYAMEHSGSREEFIAEMKRLGYGVRWEDGRKNITYTCYREPRYQNGALRKYRDNKLSDEKYLKENMEYEFEIRKEILAGRYDRDARPRADRRNAYGEDQRGRVGTVDFDGGKFTSTYTEYDEGAQGYVYHESVVYDENGSIIEESGEAYERADNGSGEDHHGRERKTGWEAERAAYFDSHGAKKERKHTVVGSPRVQHAPVRGGLAVGAIAGLASLTDSDDDNKTAEEIEAEERARLAGQNVAAVLELVKLGVELSQGVGDSEEPVSEPTMKM